jgi:hypothetical protein
MRKIILFILIFILLLFIPQIVNGQDFTTNVPGLTCGVAGDVTGKDSCCDLPEIIKCDGTVIQSVSVIVDGIAVIVPGFNLISDIIDKAKTNCGYAKDFVDKQSADTKCLTGEPTTTGSSCKCVGTNIVDPNTIMIKMCTDYLATSYNPNELTSCLNCANKNGMWTGMGCLPLDLSTLIGSFILTTGIGIGGGFALLCIIYAAFMMQSSQGNPEKLKKAQEMITSCIMGLMLIIFSILIMKIIGVNILRIPGFG